MIGKVTWPGEPAMAATLGDDLALEVLGGGRRTNRAWRRSLARDLAESPRGPEHGAPGVRFLEDLARRVGGRLELGPIAHSPEGTVH